MITAFTIKNFKAIGEESVRIELKPITLLFGANSAGKSSILHALYYANEVFNNGNLNIEKITLGENNSLDLGGFKRFVHGTEKDCSIVLKFDLNLTFDPNDLEDFSGTIFRTDNPFKLLSNAKTAYAEVEISWSQVACLPYVSRYETGINGERIAKINAIDDGREGNQVAITYFNIAHRIFSDFWITSGKTLDWVIKDCITSCSYIQKSKNQDVDYLQNDKYKTRKKRQQIFDQLGRVPSSEFIMSSEIDNFGIRLYSQCDGLPYYNFKHKLEFDNIWFDDTPLAKNMRKFLNLILIEPRNQVAEFLGQMCCIGPLREIPSRHSDNNNQSVKIRKIQSRRWATGLGAWDTLYSIGQKQLYEVYKSVPSPDDNWRFQRDNYVGSLYPPSTDEFDMPCKNLEKQESISTLNVINDWLSGTKKLNTGYEIIIEHYREIPSKFLNEALRANQPLADMSELTNEIFRQPEKIRVWLYDKSRKIKVTPHEVGVGISQVLPIVVAAVGADAPLVAIEQPELHIHPALQVRLGDLFIENFRCGEVGRKTFLIETHSEHLILRLMRRMRETFLHKNTGLPPVKPADVSILYVELEGSHSIVRKMPLNDLGELVKSWPGGFFEESLREQFGDD